MWFLRRRLRQNLPAFFAGKADKKNDERNRRRAKHVVFIAGHQRNNKTDKGDGFTERGDQNRFKLQIFNDSGRAFKRSGVAQNLRIKHYAAQQKSADGDDQQNNPQNVRQSPRRVCVSLSGDEPGNYR